MRQIILIFISLFVFACTNPGNQKSEKQSETVDTLTETTPLDTVLAKFENVYKYDKDGMKEILGYNQVNDTLVEFYIQLVNDREVIELTGQAICLSCMLDIELDEDENGIAYPANEYYYETEDIVVFIRIDIESGENAKLNFAINEKLELFAMKLLKKVKE